MYDYVIVGAGAAGCVLANRLSADRPARVLLLEAGPPDRRREIAIPAAFPNLFRTEVDWAYHTTPQPALHDREVYLPRGKTLGGSSSMNAMIYTRGHSSDFDEWQAAGGEKWGAASLARAFDRIEGRVGSPAMRIEALRQLNPLTASFLDAAAETGLRRTPMPDASETGGAGTVRVMQRRGRRWSAADAYLRPARVRPNLTVVTGARATRVLFEGTRAVGVAYRQAGRTREARASAEVFLCGGAFNTPQLLMLSGIGPADQLSSCGISPVLDVPGVGENYQEHLTVVLKWRCPRPVSLSSAGTLVNLLRFLLMRRGPLTSNIAEAIGFIATDGRDEPDIELVFAPVLYDTSTPPTEHGFSIGVVLLKPRSAGRVGLRSADPADPPRIDPCFLSRHGDLDTLLAGVKRARQIGMAAAFAPWRGDELAPGSACTSDGELTEYVRASAETLYHPVGTCRMGADSASVVDPELRVRGLSGIRVADASIMPTIPRAHPCAAVLAIAHHAADFIVDARGAAADPAAVTLQPPSAS